MEAQTFRFSFLKKYLETAHVLPFLKLFGMAFSINDYICFPVSRKFYKD